MLIQVRSLALLIVALMFFYSVKLTFVALSSGEVSIDPAVESDQIA